jgi:hypothetical protein
MSSSKPKWPPLTVASGNGNGPRQNLHDRVLDLYHDTSVYLSHLKAHNQGIPQPIVDLITATQNLTGELIKSPFGEDWRRAVADLREITLDIKKTTHSTQNVLTTQSLPLSSKIRSYAQAAAGAPPPAHTVSSHGSSSPGATPSELSKDREVIVKPRGSAN